MGNIPKMIPAAVRAKGRCGNCGDVVEFEGKVTKGKDYSDETHYVATFPHVNDARLASEQKTHVVYKGARTAGANTYNAGHSSLVATNGFEKTDSQSKIYEGEGFTLNTSAQTTVTLPAGNIKLGATKIKVSAYGQKVTVTLLNKNGRSIPNNTRALGSDTASSKTYDIEWDLSKLTDSQIDGLYVIVDMHSADYAVSNAAVGTNISSTSKVQFNSIVVTY